MLPTGLMGLNMNSMAGLNLKDIITGLENKGSQ